jgi:DNA-binding beta-propeller fold protein YncE/tRNA A-37 threonylcarbamoyl transferase component Bud32
MSLYWSLSGGWIVPEKYTSLPDMSDGDNCVALPSQGEAPSLSPGDTVDDFEILEEVGAGGMGIVYKARQKSLNRVVALKILHPRISGDPAMAKRFRTEAVLAANLNHPNIVRIFQIDACASPRYFTMEFVEGMTLQELVGREGYLPPAKAVEFLRQACSALQYAHGHNILHRDIKPGNILLEDSLEFVRVSDFGIAAEVRARLSEGIQERGVTAGTPGFMSPEQNLGQELDQRTDIYSLGMTFYYMLTGKKSYDARDRSALAVAMTMQSVKPPSAFNPEITEEIDRIALKMIAVDPRDRYPDCAALEADLRGILSPEGERAAYPRKAGSLLRRPVTAIVASACITLGAIGWLSQRGPGKPSRASQAAAIFEITAFLPGGWCCSVDLSPGRQTVFVRTHFADWNEGIRMYDTATSRKLKDLEKLPGVPWSVLASADGESLYATYYYGNEVVKVDLSSSQVLGSISVGPYPHYMVFDSSRRFLYVGVNSPGTGAIGSIAAIDTSTDTVVRRIDLDGEPGSFMILSEDDAFLYVLSLRLWHNKSETLYKIRTADLSPVQTLALDGVRNGGVSLNPDGHLLYVGNAAAGLVHSIDTTSMTETGSFIVPDVQAFSVAPSGDYALAVTHPKDSSEVFVHVFDMSRRRIVQTLSRTVTGENREVCGKSIVWDRVSGRAFIAVFAEVGGVLVVSRAGQTAGILTEGRETGVGHRDRAALLSDKWEL